MNALNLYLSACRYMMQVDPEEKSSWQDLYRYLPYLRQALTCCVCGGMLRNPVSPVNMKSCQHHVCKQCIGGKMRVKPSCSWCKEWDQFTENTQLRIILQCFKNLCKYITDILGPQLTANSHTEKINLLSILRDGVNIEEYKYPAKNKFANIANFPLPYFSFLSAVHSNTNNNVSSDDIINSSDPSCSSEFLESANFSADQKVKHFTSTSEADYCKTQASLSSDEEEAEAASSATERELQRKSDSLHGHVTSGSNKSRKSLSTEGGSKSDKASLNVQHFYSKLHTGEINSNAENLMRQSSSSGNEMQQTGSKEHKTDSNNAQQAVPVKRTKVENESSVAVPQIKKGCRCGTANLPNKLTCYCQRCPCYSVRIGCVGCKCRGCRNPYNKRKTTPQVCSTNESQSETAKEVNVET